MSSKSKATRKETSRFSNHQNDRTMCFSFFSLSHKCKLCCRRLGLPWVSAVDDLMSVRKALAAGLFSNAAQYVSTTVESRDKEHTGVDMYHLVRSTGYGQSHISLISLYLNNNNSSSSNNNSNNNNNNNHTVWVGSQL